MASGDVGKSWGWCVVLPGALLGKLDGTAWTAWLNGSTCRERLVGVSERLVGEWRRWELGNAWLGT